MYVHFLKTRAQDPKVYLSRNLCPLALITTCQLAFLNI